MPLPTPVIADSVYTPKSSSTGTSHVLTAPTFSVGDLLLVYAFGNANATGISLTISEAGWTQVTAYSSTLSDCHITVLWKVAEASDTDVTITCSTSCSLAGVYMTITGADTTTPITDYQARSDTDTTYDLLMLNTGEIVTTADNSLVLCGSMTDFGNSGYTGTFTFTSGWTQVQQGYTGATSVYMRNIVTSLEVVTAGSVGAYYNYQGSGTNLGAGISVAIQPGAPAVTRRIFIT